MGGKLLMNDLLQDVYRTLDGRGYFTFRFVESTAGFEIDLIYVPDYEGKPSDPTVTRRTPSDRGGYRIQPSSVGIPRTLDEARSEAARWAENTWRYIRDGQPIS